MTRNTPKYFHYFLACLAFDCFFLIGFSYLFNVSSVAFIVGAWVISNFVNYPRVASRRFISFYKLLVLTIKQLAVFFAIYVLVLILTDNNWLELPVKSNILFIGIVFLSRLLFVFLLRFYRIKGRGFNRFFLIGDSPAMTQMKHQFLSKKGYGYIFEGQSNTLDIKLIKEKIVKQHLNEIYCSSQAVDQSDLLSLLRLSFQFDVNVHVISDNNRADLALKSDSSLVLEYSDLNLEKFPLIDQKNLMLKRIFDIIFSLLVIVGILWWVTIILGIIIKLDSKGPVFFRQPRAGRNGQYFICLKFRSMRISNIERQATKNDNRITKVGKVIRKLSIDELPQFVNVLIGDMSVVGPRPHIKLLNDEYADTVENYNDRMLVKPGITGLSQITGHRGETKGVESMSNRIKVDILYTKTWSLYLDLVIIFRTVNDILFMKNEDVF